MTSEVTFGPSAAETILEQFGKTLDDEGYIIDEETGERVESNLGNEITIEELGGIGKGSQIFIEKDFVSVSKFVESKHIRDE